MIFNLSSLVGVRLDVIQSSDVKVHYGFPGNRLPSMTKLRVLFMKTGYYGRFPFSQNFRNFRLGGKWNTFRRFVPLENSQKKVENLKRWARFPGWNFRTECRVPFTFLVVCTSSRSTVGHRATYRGLRPNGTTFSQSEIPLLLPPKFPGFFRKWKAPLVFELVVGQGEFDAKN